MVQSSLYVLIAWRFKRYRSWFSLITNQYLGSRIISLNNNDIIDVFWVTSSIQKAIVEKNEQERVITKYSASLNQEELENINPCFQPK